jgi:hypothetical protein
MNCLDACHGKHKEFQGSGDLRDDFAVMSAFINHLVRLNLLL